MSEYDCLLSPVMTEKAMNRMSGVHTFRVHPDATRIEISSAVEKIFDVKVAKVNILNRDGKQRRFRGRIGETKARKLAVVRLSKGTINFEGGI